MQATSLPPLVMALLPLAVFWPLVRGEVLYWGTPLLQFYPWRKLAVEMIRSGHPPLWNHLLGNGAPLAANLQTAAFYPLNAIYLFIPVERAMGYSVILHVALAGIFMYIFARSLGLGILGGTVSGIAYMLSAFVVSRASFLSMTCAIAWLPLLFALAERLVRRLDGRSAALLGLAVGLQFLAGHAQLWYYGLWGIGAYVIYRAWSTGQWRKALALMTLAVALGIGVAAVQFLPTAELALLSQRRGGVEYEFAMTYSLWPWRLITFLAPNFFGSPADGNWWGYGAYWEGAGYMGVLPFLFALAALAVRPRPKHVLFFAAMALVSIMLALGRNLPLYPLLFRWVPGFGFFQAPARFLCLYTLAMALLAGTGVESLRASQRLSRMAGYGMALGMGVGLAALLVARLMPSVPATFAPATTRLALWLIGAALLLKWRAWGKRPFLWQLAVVTMVAMELALFGCRLNPTIDPLLYQAPTRSGAFLQSDPEPFRIFTFHRDEYRIEFNRYLRFQDFGPRELRAWLEFRETQVPNLSMFEGLFSAGNFDPLLIRDYHELVEKANQAPLESALRLLGLMNVRYIINDQPIPGLTPVFSDTVFIFRNPECLPRVYVTRRAYVMPDLYPSERVKGLMTPPGGQSLPSSKPGELFLPSPGDIAYDVRVLRYIPNGVEIDVTLADDGYLVLSDTYYPGWRVYVDGEERRLLRANHAFRAVWLEAGEHQVLFHYDPLSFKVGAIVSLSALSLCLGLMVFPGLRTRPTVTP